MKSWLRFVLIGVSLVCFDQEALAAINIRGAASCAVWIETREQDKQEYARKSHPHQMWLIGFLSGLASGKNKDFWGNPNVNELDSKSAVLWVDNYCRANLLKDIDDAGVALFLERTKGR